MEKERGEWKRIEDGCTFGRRRRKRRQDEEEMQECLYGGSFSFRVICGSLVVRIDAASRPITIHRTTITPLGYIPTRRILVSPSYALYLSLARTRALLHALLSFSADLLHLSTCLITNSQAHLPASLEKNCSGFELLRVTPFSLTIFLSPLLRAALELLSVIPPVGIQIIPRGADYYLLAACIEYSGRSFSQF